MNRQEKDAVFSYEGKPISLYSDDRDTYVNLTNLAKAWRGRKSIRSWMRNSNTIEFLTAWEEKYNPNFKGVQMDTFKKEKIDRDDLSIKYWIEQVGATGIFTRRA